MPRSSHDPGADSTDNPTAPAIPTYNWSPLTLSSFLKAAESPFYAADKHYRNLIVRYVAPAGKDKSFVVSKTQATDLVSASFIRGSWKKPKRFAPDASTALDPSQAESFVLNKTGIETLDEQGAVLLASWTTDTDMAEEFMKTHDYSATKMLIASDCAEVHYS